MPADNGIYDQPGDIWWDERQPLHAIRTSLNPVRLEYFASAFAARGLDPAGKVIIDVGCGGGLVAEEVARLGAEVIGIDPSAASIATARAHAAGRGLAIDYRIGSGEHLPAGDGCADVVYCVDVLEHVADPDAVIGETARVLKPGGLYLFDTINRTALSKLVAIKVMQQWPLTRLVDATIHDWDMFIRPGELAGVLERHGLKIGETAGLGPRASLATVFASFVAARRGRITHAEFSRRLDVGRITSTAVSYMGFATKAAGPIRGAGPSVQRRR